MTSIITHEIEERYPYPDNGERPVTQTRLGACLASRKAYGAGATRNPTDREIDMAALAIYTGTSGMSVEEVLPLWPDMNPDANSFTIEGRHLMIDFIFEHYGILTDISELEAGQ